MLASGNKVIIIIIIIIIIKYTLSCLFTSMLYTLDQFYNHESSFLSLSSVAFLLRVSKNARQKIIS